MHVEKPKISLSFFARPLHFVSACCWDSLPNLPSFLSLHLAPSLSFSGLSALVLMNSSSTLPLIQKQKKITQKQETDHDDNKFIYMLLESILKPIDR